MAATLAYDVGRRDVPDEQQLEMQTEAARASPRRNEDEPTDERGCDGWMGGLHTGHSGGVAAQWGLDRGCCRGAYEGERRAWAAESGREQAARWGRRGVI